MLLLSIPRVRLDKRLGFIDDSFHATTIGLDAFHVHPVDTFGELCHVLGERVVHSSSWESGGRRRGPGNQEDKGKDYGKDKEGLDTSSLP